MERKIRMFISRNMISLTLLTVLSVMVVSKMLTVSSLTQINTNPLTGYFALGNITLSGDMVIILTIILVLIGVLFVNILKIRKRSA